jgi:hypothetical protein
MQSAHPRVKYHNRLKVLLCYLLAWGLALAVPLLALWWLYPYKLAGTAPVLAAPFAGLAAMLPEAARAALGNGSSGAALTAALDARDLLWRATVAAVAAAAWLLSLLWQLLWRVRFTRPRHGARTLRRAMVAYRLSMLAVLLINAAGVAAVTLMGLRLVASPGLWDYLICLCGFVCAPIAALACFRLAAPPAISGKRSFFKRL